MRGERMRILIVHAEDRPDRGSWAAEKWDRVIDLGVSGEQAYERWSKAMSVPVVPVRSLGLDDGEFKATADFLRAGGDRLGDKENLDWWALTAILFYEKAAQARIFGRLVESMRSSDVVAITRPGFQADVLRCLIGSRVTCFAGPTASKWRRRFGIASKFSLAQIGEIFWDKYDASYRARGSFHGFRRPNRKPLVLLPSAYINASRTAVAYAEIDPSIDYLLVATRRSGWQVTVSRNVAVAKLASYARWKPEIGEEYRDLVERWSKVRRELEQVPEIVILARLGSLDSFPTFIRKGLAVREAWRTVFEREPIQSVLCADDSNPYTTIPLQLARNRGLPAIAAHHGALDGRQLFKPKLFDVVLAKGRMEEDYLANVCGIEHSRIEVGAPLDRLPRALAPEESARDARSIVFFSEGFEVAGARAEDIYRDVVPGVAQLAANTGRELIIKLHPFESRREREKLVARVLSPALRRVTRVVSGGLTTALICDIWFGITILSTAATECALAGVPCFLCGWLNYSPWGYVRQFSKFGVGRVLHSPAEIADVPAMLENYSRDERVKERLCQQITAERLQKLLARGQAVEELVQDVEMQSSCEMA